MKSSEKVEEKQKPLESSSEAIGKKKNYWVGLYWPLLINISMCSHNYFFPCLFPLLLYSPFTHTCRSPRQIKAETRDACGCFTSKAHRHVKAPLHFLLFPFFQCHLTNDWTWQFFRRNSVTAGPWLPYYSTNKRGDEETIWVGKKKHGSKSCIQQ